MFTESQEGQAHDLAREARDDDAMDMEVLAVKDARDDDKNWMMMRMIMTLTMMMLTIMTFEMTIMTLIGAARL